jgi:hypothetical protein
MTTPRSASVQTSEGLDQPFDDSDVVELETRPDLFGQPVSVTEGNDSDDEEAVLLDLDFEPELPEQPAVNTATEAPTVEPSQAAAIVAVVDAKAEQTQAAPEKAKTQETPATEIVATDVVALAPHQDEMKLQAAPSANIAELNYNALVKQICAQPAIVAELKPRTPVLMSIGNHDGAEYRSAMSRFGFFAQQTQQKRPVQSAQVEFDLHCQNSGQIDFDMSFWKTQLQAALADSRMLHNRGNTSIFARKDQLRKFIALDEAPSLPSPGR